jgi:hypothetical protein
MGSAAGGMIFPNDRTVLVYSMSERDCCWMLDAAVLLRGRAPRWHHTGSDVQPLRRPLFPSGTSASVGNYFVSIVRTEREVWIDRTMRVVLEDSNVLLLDEADDPIVPPVVLGRTTVSPNLGPCPQGAPPQMIADTLGSAMHAAIAELQRRVEKSVVAHHFLHE